MALLAVNMKKTKADYTKQFITLKYLHTAKLVRIPSRNKPLAFIFVFDCTLQEKGK